MKQHILPKQALEIPEDYFYKIFNGDIVKRNDWYKYHHKKVTIGVMIEFLHNKKIALEINSMYTFYRVGSDQPDLPAVSRTELCDALWEIVKYELIK